MLSLCCSVEILKLLHVDQVRQPTCSLSGEPTFLTSCNFVSKRAPSSRPLTARGPTSGLAFSMRILFAVLRRVSIQRSAANILCFSSAVKWKFSLRNLSFISLASSDFSALIDSLPVSRHSFYSCFLLLIFLIICPKSPTSRNYRRWGRESRKEKRKQEGYGVGGWWREKRKTCRPAIGGKGVEFWRSLVSTLNHLRGSRSKVLAALAKLSVYARVRSIAENNFASPPTPSWMEEFLLSLRFFIWDLKRDKGKAR